MSVLHETMKVLIMLSISGLFHFVFYVLRDERVSCNYSVMSVFNKYA